MDIDTESKFSFSFENFLKEEDERTDFVDGGGGPRYGGTGHGGPEDAVCHFFLRGLCQRGDKCPYRHTKLVSSGRKVVCKHWLRGLCKKGDTCEYLHEFDLARMPICFFYTEYGECNNDECVFRHVKVQDKIIECPWYARGFCRQGPNCRHKHVKRTLCPDYLAGFCPKGAACPHGHPKFDQHVSAPLRASGGGIGIPLGDQQQQQQQQQQHSSGGLAGDAFASSSDARPPSSSGNTPYGFGRGGYSQHQGGGGGYGRGGFGRGGGGYRGGGGRGGGGGGFPPYYQQQQQQQQQQQFYYQQQQMQQQQQVERQAIPTFGSDS